MKTRSLCTGAIRAVLVLAVAAALAVCAPPLDTRNEGNLRIVLAGGTSAGARALSPETIAGLSYRLDFSGPNGETLSRTLEPGTQTLSLNLTLGDWTIQAEAFNEDGVVYGNGETTITVEAGRINDAMIPMREATPEDLPKEITAFSFDGLTPSVAIDAATKTVAVTVPYDTVVTSLVPTITVSSGASVSPASGEAQDFTSPVSYTVTAGDGSTETWSVTVTIAASTAKEITGFSFEGLTPPVTGSVDPVMKTIAVTVPSGTVVTGLVPTIDVSSGASIDPASGDPQDFSSPASYTVTAGDGSTETWTVTVTIAPNTAKEITAFSFTSPPVTGIVDPAMKTVTVTVPSGTVVTSLVPTITVSSGANIDPASGDPRDFSGPVSYTVTAADGTTETWTVTVTVAPSTAKKITDFSFNSLTPPVTGTIDPAMKTVAVSLPYGTVVTSLVPTIDVSSGASIDPASGDPRDFTGSVSYTVTAEDGSTETWTVTVTVRDFLATVAEVGAYLASASGGGSAGAPVILPPVALNLADTGGNGWVNLLGAINKYVALNLSACTMSGTVFDPGTANTGESRIVSLILPGGAAFVKAGTSSTSSTFKNFTRLESVAGINITNVGDYAFSGCATLTTTDFPVAISVGDFTFNDCTSLTTADFPVATSVGIRAFSGCTSLTMVDFPVATSIGGSAFSGCIALTMVDFPVATSVGAFYGCTALTTAEFPVATSVDVQAFEGCIALTTADFPLATTIGQQAFSGCTSLTVVDLAAATSIGQFAFEDCTSLTTADFPVTTSI
jgi:hypothetical protein